MSSLSRISNQWDKDVDITGTCAKNSLCCKTVAIFIGGISKSKFLRYVDDLIDLRHGQDCMKISLGPPFGASSLKIAFPMCPRFPAMGFTP